MQNHKVIKSYIGNCINENLINELFDNVSNFALLIEENGDNFTINNIIVEYDENTDVHSFYLI
jgi:hypothetical protein